MVRFIAVRAAQAVLAIVAASMLVFVLLRLSGDPVARMLPDTAGPEAVATMRAELGLDRPLHEQYLRFAGDALRGDFGDSIRFARPALGLILERVPATLLLGGVAFALTVLFGIPGGVYAAARHGGNWDRLVRLFATLGQAMPTFWLGTLLILLFAVRLRWFPTSGAGGIEHVTLPAVTLGLFGLAGLARMARSSTLEALRAEYVRFARVKGVPERFVLWRHAFPNAALSVLTFSGLLLINLLSGSVIVETVFGWPGVGATMIEAAHARDFPVIQAAAMLLAAAYVAVNFLVDVCYGLLNPRIGGGS
jgi:peptide/nickel transport system permease protein